MRRAAAGLDLAPFLAAYRADGQGNTAYHPPMMVALIMYCYCKGIRSSRAIEMATWDDVEARVICGGCTLITRRMPGSRSGIKSR
jgi:transposase